MEIMRVKDELVCTQRVPGLKVSSLRVLETQTGGLMVPRCRWAMADFDVMTDLTICGIIDNWQ